MADSIRVGTSGWAYASWKPVFYPEKLAQKKFLQHYASRLNAVEVNYSFRHLIGEKTLDNWIAETPAGFAFCVKAHQGITHIRRLQDTDEILGRFLNSIEPLAAAGKLGPVLFQLPPNLKADAARLREFLTKLPRALRAAFEFRHQSWFTDEVFGVLRERNAALCLAESDELATPDVATADFSYYRFRRADYSPQERGAIAARLRETGRLGAVYAFFKHEEKPESALWAEEILSSAKSVASHQSPVASRA